MSRNGFHLPTGAIAGAVAVLLGCGALRSPAEADQSAQTGALAYIGTRLDGPGKTIFAVRLDENTGALTLLGGVGEVSRPTWLIADPRRPELYSVSETGNDGLSSGAVYSLSVDKATGALSVVDHVDSGGGGATYLDLDTKSNTLFVGNFGTGNVSTIPVLANGAVGEVAAHPANYGSGPLPRQKGPHAHAATLDPSRRWVLSPDLGADRIFIYRFDPRTRGLSPGDPAFATVPPGSGPRHVVFHPNGKFVFLMTELSAEIRSWAWDAEHGRMTLVQTLQTLPADYKGPKSGCEIALSSDGRFLYASDRGDSNTVLLYSVNAATGELKELQRVSSGGVTPWSFTIDPTGRWMVVANEGSGNLSVIGIDPATGKMTPTNVTLSVPHPSKVTFVESGSASAAPSK